MSEQFEARLAECLDALENPQQSAGIEELLARYSDDAPALRRVLGVAAALPSLDQQPDPRAQAESRRKFLAAAAGLSGPARAERSSGLGSLVLRCGAILLAVFAAGAIPVAASGDALPGDPLYGVKIGVESVQLQLAPDTASREAVAARNNARRIEEVDGLLRIHRDAQTEFDGRLDTVSPETLTVSGRSITIPPGFAMPGIPAGTLVAVTVQVRGGLLILVAIQPIGPVEMPAPTATPVPKTLPSQTPESRHTDGPKVDHTAEPTEDANHGETTGGDDGEPKPTDDGGENSGETPTIEPTEDGADNSGGSGGDNSGSDDSGGHGGGGGDD